MIGRGTRVLDLDKIKPWCPGKDHFLIMDCWENFAYFNMNPPGKEPSEHNPLPVRLFKTRLKKLASARDKNRPDILERVKQDLRSDLGKLPSNSVVILENQFSSEIDFVTKTTVLGTFDFRAFLNIAMLISESERARILRQAILDIAIDTINKRTGGGAKYINQRDEDFPIAYFQKENYRRSNFKEIHIAF